MIKLEVRMYARHNYFGIGKITNSYESSGETWFNVKFKCYEEDEGNCGICEQSVGFKVSHNIIDLIEVGDVLLLYDIENGENYKSEVITDSQNNLCIVNFDIDRLINLGEGLFMDIVKIKSIATKEQFESISYKID